MAFEAPPGYQPTYNPSIPYMGPINGGLRAGMSLYIQGKIQISGFHVNLMCGEFEGSDVAFHVNPRLDLGDKVVFNTFQNGTWEEEEEIQKMPFNKGEHFELVIVANSDGYQVNVNGQEFYLFQHRIPLERVCALEIGGDVSIDSINVLGGMGLQPIFNPGLPYSGVIPGGIVSKAIIIRGMVPYGADRFHINFFVGGTKDIAFHFNPRIGEGLVVRNSLISDCWGEEERDLDFNPFMEGQFFEMSICCGEEKFTVFVNGKHMCTYSHRFQPYNQIDMLEMHGDVQLSYIHY